MQLAFHFGVVTGSEYDEDGHLGIQLDHFGEAGSVPAEVITPFGFLSRPLDPEVDGDASPQEGCTAMWCEEGSRTAATPLSDTRVLKKLPKVRKGGSMTYCAAGSYALFDGKDPAGVKVEGSYYVSVKYGATGARKSHLFAMVNATEGSEFVSLFHGKGQGILMTASGSIIVKNSTGKAYIEANETGLNIAGDVSAQGAWRIGEPSSAGALVLEDRLMTFLESWEKLIIAGIAAGGGSLSPFVGAAKGLGTKQLLAT